ncbi:MAG: hypothetical protein AB1410_00175 [Acidobacteriota bacterium]
MPEEDMDKRLLSNFCRLFRELEGKYDVYIIDIRAAPVGAFEEQFKTKFGISDFEIKSFIIQRD